MDKDTQSVMGHVHGSTPGDAAPLYVRYAQFETLKISQTLPYPCAVNRICVTLVPSVPMSSHKNSFFSIGSFDGAESPVGEISLVNSTSATSAVTDDDEDEGWAEEDRERREVEAAIAMVAALELREAEERRREAEEREAAEGAPWLVSQYNLMMAVPNAAALEVAELNRRTEEAAE